MKQSIHTFFDLSSEDLKRLLEEKKCSLAHIKTLMTRAYKDLEEEPWIKQGFLPKSLEDYQRLYPGQSLNIHQMNESAYDHSVKFVFILNDGLKIESVLMPETSRLTVCLSTQVGCRQGCVFCHTGRMGLSRNLTQGEILGQVLSIKRWLKTHSEWLQKNHLPLSQEISNVVFMGMGEPLDNVEPVLGAISMMIHPYGFAIGRKKITVSTAGHLDGLHVFLGQSLGVGLALSLHETREERRNQLMPINKRYPLSQVLDFLRLYFPSSDPKGDKLMIQYTLIKGVNDQPEDARRLHELLQGLAVKINLIPLNEIGPSRLQSPDPSYLEDFAKILYGYSLRTMIRFSKGQDINAACGQLVSL